jgi:hypothetical protein
MQLTSKAAAADFLDVISIHASVLNPEGKLERPNLLTIMQPKKTAFCIAAAAAAAFVVTHLAGSEKST